MNREDHISVHGVAGGGAWYQTETYLYGSITAIQTDFEPFSLILNTDEYGQVEISLTDTCNLEHLPKFEHQEIGLHVALEQNLNGDIKNKSVIALSVLNYAPDLDRFIEEIESGKFTPRNPIIKDSVAWVKKLRDGRP